MSNTLTPLSPTYWSRIMGRKLYNVTVFRSQASFEEQATLKDGQIVDRPYRSDIVAETYTKGTAMTAQDLTATSDQLTVNKFKAMLMYVDNVDKIQNKWDSAKVWAEEAALRLAIIIDAEYLYEVVNANNTVDDGDLGGTSGNGITLATTNLLNTYGKVNRKLDIQNVPREERFINISPQWYDVLWQFIAGKESLLGDKTGEYNNIGSYAGLKHYLTNNLTASAVWTPANAPTAADTITISGVTFTFVDTIGTTAGNVLVNGGTVAQVITRLTTLINAPSTTTANGVAFSGADLRTVQQMVAVDGTTYITVYHKGQSYLTVAGSDATDVWSKKIQHNLAGRKGAIDVVIQKEPNVDMASTVSAGKSGMNILPMAIFGVKTFNQGKNEIVDVKISSSAF